MSYFFPSDEWAKAAMDAINSSVAYEKAAARWEGDITFVIAALPGDKKERYIYMDLWHGKCRSAGEIDAPSEVSSAYTITAPLRVWRQVLAGELDPIRGLMSRQLRMQGNMMQVLKAPRAAVELVNSCAQVETRWPA
jgi:putative sterol carrier protein